ncbi:DEAD/DEAH box helicase [Kiloniella antarctica]|uniref:DEAD/DEAH box helicase n=1 Tax=Kiloniella antarctica TaxID=1550907 RepID=A0ABW5BKY8_9PROT
MSNSETPVNDEKANDETNVAKAEKKVAAKPKKVTKAKAPAKAPAKAKAETKTKPKAKATTKAETAKKSVAAEKDVVEKADKPKKVAKPKKAPKVSDNTQVSDNIESSDSTETKEKAVKVKKEAKPKAAPKTTKAKKTVEAPEAEAEVVEAPKAKAKKAVKAVEPVQTVEAETAPADAPSEASVEEVHEAEPVIEVDPFEGVHPALAKALGKKGYKALTPVQKAVLAPELRDADALVSAQTGSGKTVAFGISLAPTLLGDDERFKRAAAPLALIITPTRELALQVMRELEWLYANTGAHTATCVGGMDMRTERSALNRGAHIVVGTPGRLRDHIERGSLNISALRAVVLDEADEMLDLGFRDDLEYMLDTTPKERRTLMFSATVPRSIGMLAKRYQRNAVRVSTKAEEKQHSDIEYRALTVAPNDKENAILNLIRFYEPKNAIVFCATRATVNHMVSRFANRGFDVVALSGELSQNLRSHAIQSLRDGRAQVCIATDVAARGLDLPDLELVVHADIPKSREPLLHRSGRTGRAGRKGISALIVPYNWRKRTERLLDSAKVQATWANPPSVEEIIQRDRERFLATPTLIEPVKDDEQAFVKELLEKHGAEQIAAALIRTQNAGRPAPEELISRSDKGGRDRDERGGRDRDRGRDRDDRGGDRGGERGGRGGRNDNFGATRKERVDFEDGVWISMTVGRKHTADPKWLLPMVCRAGCITKNEIGAIRIHMAETHVELTPKGAEKFFETIGNNDRIEKTITVKRLEGIPEEPDDVMDDKNAKGFHRQPRDSKKQKPFRDNFNRSDRSKEYSNRAAEGNNSGTQDEKSGDKKFGDRKFGDKKFGDKPFAKKKFGDRKAGERDYANKSGKPKSRGKFGSDGKFNDPQADGAKKTWIDDGIDSPDTKGEYADKPRSYKGPKGGRKSYDNKSANKSGNNGAFGKPFKSKGDKPTGDKTRDKSGSSSLKRKGYPKKD